MLIEAGARVDVRDSYGNTPLWRAVMESRGDGSVIAVLRLAGADPYVENNSGVSPVALARRIGNYDVKQFFSDLPGENDAL
jgi:ankyrin repeat protein